MRRIVSRPWGSVVFGLLCFAVAAMGYSPQVECHGRPMSPAQTCTVTEDGRTFQRSYDEQRQIDQIFTYVMTGAGGIFLLTGLGRVLVRRRRKAAARDAALHLIPPAA